MLPRMVAVLATCALLALAALSPRTADARWDPRYGSTSPEVQQWYKKQHNKKGQWCCDEGDGHPVAGDDYHLNDDGSVTLFGGTPRERTLPEYMVIDGPNLAGHAVWWYLETGVTHTDFCFAPGTLT